RRLRQRGRDPTPSPTSTVEPDGWTASPTDLRIQGHRQDQRARDRRQRPGCAALINSLPTPGPSRSSAHCAPAPPLRCRRKAPHGAVARAVAYGGVIGHGAGLRYGAPLGLGYGAGLGLGCGAGSLVLVMVQVSDLLAVSMGWSWIGSWRSPWT
ncbi:hypothetical protein CEXT_392441, partial [Caerostris extrusa]